MVNKQKQFTLARKAKIYILVLQTIQMNHVLFLFGQIGLFLENWNCRAKSKICYLWGYFFSTFHGQNKNIVAFSQLKWQLKWKMKWKMKWKVKWKVKCSNATLFLMNIDTISIIKKCRINIPPFNLHPEKWYEGCPVKSTPFFQGVKSTWDF